MSVNATHAKAQLAVNLYTCLRRQVEESDNWPKTLAQLTGISVTSAQRYLSPERADYSFPALDQLMVIAAGLQISTSELVRGIGSQPSILGLTPRRP